MNWGCVAQLVDICSKVCLGNQPVGFPSRADLFCSLHPLIVPLLLCKPPLSTRFCKPVLRGTLFSNIRPGFPEMQSLCIVMHAIAHCENLQWINWEDQSADTHLWFMGKLENSGAKSGNCALWFSESLHFNFDKKLFEKFWTAFQICREFWKPY